MCSRRVTVLLWVAVLFFATQFVRAEMVHHWEFEGNSNDAVGGWNGTGGIGFVPGKMGQAANFGGTAASDITFTFNTAGLKNITVAFWMKLDAAWTPSKAGIGRVMGSADNFECVLGPSGGGTGQVANNFYISGGTYPLSTTIPTPNTWYHVALTSSLSTAGGTGRAEVWINGVMEAAQDNRAINDWTSGAFAFGQRPGAGGYRFPGLLDDIRIYNTVLAAGEIAAAMQGGGPTASNASPADQATDVIRDIVLSWKPADVAKSHDVYFGTVFDNVNNASRTSPLGVLVSQGQDANSYDPAGLLALGQTYYWRIDEIDASSKVTKGLIWSFTAEPVVYPIKNIAATASSVQSAETGPGKTVDGSGLANDLHSTTADHMWLSDVAVPLPAWIQYEFDRVHKLQEMWVWNSNQLVEGALGIGAKDVTIEISTDGAVWTLLSDTQFARGTGLSGYAHNTIVDFKGAVAKYVRLTIKSNWAGILSQTGLSEVRFYSVPVLAREPNPASGSTGVSPQVTLSWRAGREAASHLVYVSTDQQAVIDGTAAMATVVEPRYEPSVDLGQSYYWKVVEVNEAQTPPSWEGDVWSFSTADWMVVDDFESYTNDSPNRVFQTWIDGMGFSADEFFPNGNPGNGSGAVIGYDPAAGNIMETTLIHGGKQSMPLSFDNTAGSTVSEATRTFDSALDWTKHGIATLVLYFYGDPANTAGQVYVKINTTKVFYNATVNAIKTPYWTQWNIPLASVGANLKAVTKLAIGVEGSGKGILYVDDIRLYRTAPAAPQELIWIEAESGSPTAPLMMGDDPTASGGKYISTEDLGLMGAHVDGIATYKFTVKGGVYRLQGRVIEPATNGNSFWVRLPGATLNTTPAAADNGWMNWGFPAGARTWQWSEFANGATGIRCTLAAGTYTLEIAYREDGAQLDAIVITNAAE